MFVPAAERYSAKLHSNILPLHGTSKAALVIAQFAQDKADAKEIAKQAGFASDTELAGYIQTRTGAEESPLTLFLFLKGSVESE